MECITSFTSRHRLAISLFLAEFIGTFILVVIGDGAVATYAIQKNQANVFTSVFTMCLGFGIGVMIAMYASSKISGAHINPAATVALAIKGDTQWKHVPVYLVAQYLGAFVGALVLYINYTEAFNALDGGQRAAMGLNATGGIFATYPASYATIWGALVDQIIGTGVLLFGISAVTDKNNLNLSPKHQPLMVGLVVTMTCVAFFSNCGAIFNPARDLSPRLMTYLFGYGPDVFKPLDGTYWFVAGIIGPHIGAIFGVYLYKVFIGMSLEGRDEYDLRGQLERRAVRDFNEKNNEKDNRAHQDSSKYGATMREFLFDLVINKSMESRNRPIIALFLAEFIGTFILVIIGEGAVATYTLSNGNDTFAICLAFGVGAMIAVFSSSKISGAHINPAASVAFAIKGDMQWKHVPVYMAAQYLGSFMAAVVLYVNYVKDILANDEEVSLDPSLTSASIFATYPGARTTIWAALLDQILGTSVLLFGTCAVTDKNNLNLEPKHQPLMVALVITMTAVAFFVNCSAIFNPARDLAPRIMTYMFGYGPAVFQPLDSWYWLVAGVIGPHIGAIVGVYAYKYFIGIWLENGDDEIDLKGSPIVDRGMAFIDASLNLNVNSPIVNPQSNAVKPAAPPNLSSLPPDASNSIQPLQPLQLLQPLQPLQPLPQQQQRKATPGEFA